MGSPLGTLDMLFVRTASVWVPPTRIYTVVLSPVKELQDTPTNLSLHCRGTSKPRLISHCNHRRGIYNTYRIPRKHGVTWFSSINSRWNISTKLLRQPSNSSIAAKERHNDHNWYQTQNLHQTTSHQAYKQPVLDLQQ